MNPLNDYFLMLETDADDRFITASSIGELNIPARVQFVCSSNELFPFLEKHPRPRHILINSNCLPDDGLTVLRQIKTKPEYKGIPVTILSDSTNPGVISEYYMAGAISFIEKPSTFEGTRQKIRSFFEYWMMVAEV